MDAFERMKHNLLIMGALNFLETIMKGNILKENRPACGYFPEQSPQVMACLQDIIKSKKVLGKNVKKDKCLLDEATKQVREFIVTQDRDTQIKILKLLQ